jgi:hypothetical protein
MIYAENTDIEISNSTFSTNQIVVGDETEVAVLYSFWDVQSTIRCPTSITNSVFQNNIASNIGGVIKYNLFEPTLTNVSFISNSFNKNIVSFALKLQLVDENNDVISSSNTSSIFSTKSGYTVTSEYRVGVFDQESIFDIQHVAYGFIEITTNNGPKVSISKNTVSLPSNGVLIFDDFILTGPPTSTAEMEVNFEDIDADKLEILGLNRSLAFVVFQIYIEPWEDGEIIVDEVICERCPEGTYIFNNDATQCEDCMEHATCEGGTTILVHQGYWRPYNTSRKVIECDYSGAWLGGYNSEWETGYTGNLWKQWVYDKEIKYIRSSQSECSECPGKLTRVIRIFFGLFFTIAFYVLFLVSFLKNGTTGRTYETALYRIMLHHFTSLVIIKSFDLNWPEMMQSTLDVLAFFFEASDEALTTKWIIDDKITDVQDVFISIIIFTFFPIIVLSISWFWWMFWLGSMITKQRNKMKENQNKSYKILNNSKQEGIKVFENYTWYERRMIQEHTRLPNMNLTFKPLFLRNMFGTFTVAIYMAHTTIWIKTLSLFSWRELEPGEFWVQEDLDIKWWESTHLFYLQRFAIPSFLISVIILPLFAFWLIIRMRFKNQRADILLFFGLMTNGLKEKYFYWDFLQILKKFLMLTLQATLLSETLFFRSIVYTFIIIMFNELLAYLEPYKSKTLHNLEFWSNMSLLSVIFAGMFFSINSGGTLYSTASNLITAIVMMSNFLFFILWMLSLNKMHRRYWKNIIQKWRFQQGIRGKIARWIRLCKPITLISSNVLQFWKL